MRRTMTAVLASSAALWAGGSLAQAVPNLGDKVCALWTAVSDRAKQDPTVESQLLMMDWWALGYLKGAATQYAQSEKAANPLLKLRGDEELEWMRAFCRLNPRKNMSEAAVRLVDELKAR